MYLNLIGGDIYVPVWLALIVAVPQILSIISQFILSWRVGQVHAEVKEVRVDMNGKADALLKLTAESEYAKGMKDEQDLTRPRPSLPTEVS